MKIVQVGNSRYYISSRDDEVSLAHQLIKQGYSIQQIAKFLNISERQVKRILQDCW
jgi:DNA-binding NarL/FixJ family response regulator